MSMYLISGVVLLLVSVVLGVAGNYSMFKEVVYLVDYHLMSLGSLDVVYEVMFDWVSCLYLSVVLLISGSVLIYSEDYMYGDGNSKRFFLLMLMFILSMIFMVISSGLVSVLLGWDGLGLVSYCLVIYYGSTSSYKAGSITIMMNRIGDALLLVSIGWMMMLHLDSNYWFLGYEGFINEYVVMVMIIIAACTKSAQIPFSAWLPEAMAAPTPVSSLVHSSTLVTAGVYLLIRFNYFFSGEGGGILLILSLTTMLMAGVGALMEKDMKKVVAMSTLSQLGLSMFSLAVGLWKIAFFHMMIHAFFKALMFLCVGNFIHGMGGNQDFRFVSMKFKSSWLMNQGLLVSIMCLMGFPFLCGFFSKDLLLELFLSAEKNVLAFMIFLMGFSMSVLYGSRLYVGVMLKINLEKSYMNYGEKNWMNVGVMIMSVPAILSGSGLGWSLNFYSLVMLSGGWKLMGLIFMMILLIYSVMLESNIIYNKSSGGGIFKDYMGSLWFLGVVSGAMWSNLFKIFKSIEMSDQEWGEENGGGGVKEYIFKNFFFLVEKFQIISYFYMIFFSCSMMFVGWWGFVV